MRRIPNRAMGARATEFEPNVPQFRGQCERILNLLLQRRGEWIPTSEFAFALQMNARIFTLRRAGYLIESRVVTVGGRRIGYYRLLATPQELQDPQGRLPLEAVSA